MVYMTKQQQQRQNQQYLCPRDLQMHAMSRRHLRRPHGQRPLRYQPDSLRQQRVQLREDPYGWWSFLQARQHEMLTRDRTKDRKTRHREFLCVKC